MALTAAGSGFVVLLFSMPAVHGQDDWGVTYPSSEICAFKGSTVEIRSSFTYPSRINGRTTIVEKSFWFTKGTDHNPVDLKTESQYKDRVQYDCHENNCRLRITDLRDSDSAKYHFRFITNQSEGYWTGPTGVNLSVTDVQVQVRACNSSTQELICNSSCRPSGHPSYVWYKNGQTVQAEKKSYSVNLNAADSYSCAFEGQEDSSPPAVCVYGQSCNRVIYTDRRICAVKGSSVDISCTYSSYETDVKSKFWFSPQRSRRWRVRSKPEDLSKDSQYAGRVQVFDTETGRSTLRITDVRQSDSAQYDFKFKTASFEWRSILPGTTLTVTDPDLQVLVGRPNTSLAALTCHSRCLLPDRPSYIWYKNGEEIPENQPYHEVQIRPTDSYFCALEGYKDSPSPSVCVDGQSCNKVIYTDRRICAFRGSSVDISCLYSSYETDVESKFWFSPQRSRHWRDRSKPEDLSKDSQYAGRVQVSDTETGRSTLRITDLTERDSAQYDFKFKTRSFEWRSILPGTTLTVTALRVQVTRKYALEYYTNAELKCLSSCSPASFVWFKNGEKIMKEESSSYRDRFYPGDNISCALKGHEQHRSPPVYALRVASVSVSPPGEIMEGKSVTLTCSTDAAGAKFTWYKSNVNLKPLSEEPQLVFMSIQSSDSGEYYCTAENKLGTKTSEFVSVNVHYGPKRPSVSVSPSAEIMEGSSVTLSCSTDANPAANYTWYKGNQRLLQGPDGSFHFSSISSEDSGIYYCTSENQYGQINSSSLFIDVQYGPKRPSVSVSPSAEIVEGSSVTLNCSTDANPAANYTWYKEDEDSPKASGQNLTITDFRAEHSGNYYCEVQNSRGRQNSTLHLTVAGAWKATAAGTISAFVFVVTLACVFLWIRKKRASRTSSEPEETPDTRQQPNLHYARVQFSRNQPDPVYCNIRPGQPRAHNDETEYSEVRFSNGRTAPRSESSAREDPFALYSTVNKTRWTKRESQAWSVR